MPTMAARKDRVFALTILVIALLAIAARIVSSLPGADRQPLTVKELAQAARVVEYWAEEILADSIPVLFDKPDSASMREKVERKVARDDPPDLTAAMGEFQISVTVIRPESPRDVEMIDLALQYSKEGDDRHFHEIVSFKFDDSGAPVYLGGTGIDCLQD